MSKTYLVISPEWGEDWNVYCLEYMHELLERESRALVIFLNFGLINPLLLLKPVRRLARRIRYSNRLEKLCDEFCKQNKIINLCVKEMPAKVVEFGFDTRETSEIDTAIKSESELPYLQDLNKNFGLQVRQTQLNIANFVASITKGIIQAYSVDQLVTVNGRFTISTASSIVARRMNIDRFLLEEGGIGYPSWEVYPTSPHDREYRSDLVSSLWRQRKNYCRDDFDSFMKNRLGRYSFDNNPESSIEVANVRESAVFFLTSLNERASLTDVGAQQNIVDEQVQALSEFVKLASARGIDRVFVKGHPQPKRPYLEKKEDIFWEKICSQLSVQYLSASSVDTGFLLANSRLNVVWLSSVAVESIFLQRPTLILGKSIISNLLPENYASNRSEIESALTNINNLISTFDKLHPWVYWQLNGGKPIKLFKRREDGGYVDWHGRKINRKRFAL